MRSETCFTQFAGKGGASGFTSDPSQLRGEMYHTALKKSSQGFGFTIIGGDRTDEFLQVKNVLSDGPAAHDNKMASGEQSPGGYEMDLTQFSWLEDV